jgi:hypothetical protein
VSRNVKNYNSFLKENTLFDEYEVIDVQKVEQLESLSNNHWSFLAGGDQKYFNALLNKDSNNLFIVLGNKDSLPKFLIFWDRMVIIDSSNSIIMFEEYDKFMKENVEIKNKIENHIKGIEIESQKSENELEDESSIGVSSRKITPFDPETFRGFHIRKEANPLKFNLFSKIPKRRY